MTAVFSEGTLEVATAVVPASPCFQLRSNKITEAALERISQHNVANVESYDKADQTMRIAGS